jgi:hypothetical protein
VTTAHATTYLIQYGRPGFVGRFRSAVALARGARVVVRGPRGSEFGEVLVSLSDASAEGDVLRVATADDDAEEAARAARGQELLAASCAAAEDSGLPLAFVDVEVTLDGCAILHALAWDACDATALLDDLAGRFGLAVRLLDLSRAPAEPHAEPAEKGCGKPGCGTGSGGCSSGSCSSGTGGGCSSGSCSRGSVKSADELTAQFAELRRKMEAAGVVRTPLN